MRLWAMLGAVAATLATAAPAAAYWNAGGAGTGRAPVGTLAAGGRPTATASGRTITVRWAQTPFNGAPLGGFAGGGYTVRRYPAAGGSAVAPGGSCAALVSGAAASLSCQEANVAPGSWRYAVTPVLGTWTGAEGAPSAALVVPGAPTGATATAAPGGRLDVSWPAVAGVAGYNVYRRTAAGSYDYAAPVNGATPVTATSYADAGGADGVTYRYVVRAVVAGGESADSPESGAATADASAPAVTLADPGAFMRATVTLTASASDAGSGIASLRIQAAAAGSGVWSDVCTSTKSPASCAIDTTTLAEGGYDLRAIATDAVGNAATALLADRFVDNTAPVALDVQTANAARGTPGRPEAGDVIAYAFSEPLRPQSVLAPWTGAAAPVTVRFTNGNPDVITVWDATNTAQVALGSVTSGKKYVTATTTFTASTMLLSGSSVTVTLGVASGPTATANGTATLGWTPSTAATDRAGNPLAAGTVSESGALDLDF